MTPATNTHGKTMTAETAQRVTWMTLKTVDIEKRSLAYRRRVGKEKFW